MKIPRKLKILGHIYTVKQVIGGELDDAMGETIPVLGLIRIRKDAVQSQKEQSLFHEIFHAINWELSEKDVEFLAQTLYAVLKENKLLRGKD